MNAEGIGVLETTPPLDRSYKRLWCAMASAIMPSLGDWILGDKKRGGLFLTLFVAQLLCY
jgi:hypothetical protein